MVNYSQISPAYLNSSVLFSSTEPKKKLGFLIRGNEDFSNPNVWEGKHIAEHNNGLTFDCLSSFEPLHLSTFLSQFPPILHKRIALYIIRIFVDTANVDDIIATFLKPAIQALIDSGQFYNEPPSWLKELNSDSILDTLTTIQKELGGYENMQAEFALTKRKLLRCSNEISSNAFKKYLEEHSDITEVYGFIDQVHLYFLDDFCTVTRFADNERHLIFMLGNRQIPVHLFGTDDTAGYRDALREFAFINGLRIPYDHEDESRVETDPVIAGYEKIVKAYHNFFWWFTKYEHYSEDHEELLQWLHEGDQSDKFIQTYQDFVQLAELARIHDFSNMKIPDEKSFDAAIQLRQAKKMQSLENRDVFPKVLSKEDRLAKSKKIYDFWLNAHPSLVSQSNLHNTLIPANELDNGAPYLEAINLAMDIIFSKRKRREKGLAHINSLHIENKHTFTLEIRDEVEKILSSRTLTLLDLLPVTDQPIIASELLSALKKYLDLIRLAKEALEKFKNREMHLFDPLVGENSCQIRAAMFTEILSKTDINHTINEVLSRLTEYAAKIQVVLEKLPAKSDHMVILKSVLLQNDALFEISEDIAIIISSFILSETKVPIYKPNKSGELTRTERLIPEILEKKGLTSKFAASLIKTAQTKLSALSVIYVQRLGLRMLLCKEEKDAAGMAFNNVKTDKLQRKLVPFYPTMRLLLTEMYQKMTLLVVKIDQFIKGESKPYDKLTLLFGNEGKDVYTLLDTPLTALNKSGVFIEAKSITDKPQSPELLKAAVLKTKIEDLILSVCASHPQYGCEDSVLDDALFKKYRQKANEWGASLENPSVCLVYHIYCNTIEKKLLDSLK